MLSMHVPLEQESLDSHSAILLVDGELLQRDCLAEALARSFHPARILCVSTVAEFSPIEDLELLLIVLRAGQDTSKDIVARETAEITSRWPEISVVVIARSDEDLLATAVTAGARGLIPLTAPLRIAVAALRLVLAGGTYFPAAVTSQSSAPAGAFAAPADEHHLTLSDGKGRGLLDTAPAAAPKDLSRPHLGPLERAEVSFSTDHPLTIEVEDAETDLPTLGVSFTAREKEVLSALQMGRSNKWIAAQLSLSENTVKVHVRHIMRKLRATNRTQAAIFSRPPSSVHSAI
jgi:DNA-binding NarL/FixJ family response regulator